jgi:hypothetical protein
MSIKSWLRSWLLDSDRKESPLLAASRPSNPIEEEASQLSFSIIRAVNGRIIKVSQYKPQQRGPDYTHELYIVKDDEKIPDVIARIMAIKALEQ